MKIQRNIASTLKMTMSQRNISLAEFAEELGIARIFPAGVSEGRCKSKGRYHTATFRKAWNFCFTANMRQNTFSAAG